MTDPYPREPAESKAELIVSAFIVLIALLVPVIIGVGAYCWFYCG